MTRKWKTQQQLNATVQDQLLELRRLIAQANSDHARERDVLHRKLESLAHVLADRTDHLA